MGLARQELETPGGDSGLCEVGNLKSPSQGPTQDRDSQWGQTTSQVQGFSLGYSGWHAKLFHKNGTHHAAEMARGDLSR